MHKQVKYGKQQQKKTDNNHLTWNKDLDCFVVLLFEVGQLMVKDCHTLDKIYTNCIVKSNLNVSKLKAVVISRTYFHLPMKLFVT